MLFPAAPMMVYGSMVLQAVDARHCVVPGFHVHRDGHTARAEIEGPARPQRGRQLHGVVGRRNRCDPHQRGQRQGCQSQAFDVTM